jgi:hypothetical protein
MRLETRVAETNRVGTDRRHDQRRGEHTPHEGARLVVTGSAPTVVDLDELVQWVDAYEEAAAMGVTVLVELCEQRLSDLILRAYTVLRASRRTVI